MAKKFTVNVKYLAEKDYEVELTVDMTVAELEQKITDGKIVIIEDAGSIGGKLIEISPGNQNDKKIGTLTITSEQAENEEWSVDEGE